MTNSWYFWAYCFLAGALAWGLWHYLRDYVSDIWEAWHIWKVSLRCEYCGCRWLLSLQSSRTAYAWGGVWEDPENPNRPRLLCRLCTAHHHQRWDEMWEEYYQGIL